MPIYTMGYANPRSFSRGKRGIAGSMIFTLFDRSALYQVMRSKSNSTDQYGYYQKETDGYTLTQTNADPWAASAQLENDAANGYTTKKVNAEYMDQIMPFNLTLIA